MVAIAMIDGNSCLWIFHRSRQSEFCELQVKSDQFKFSKFGTWLHFIVDLLYGVCERMGVVIALDATKYLTIKYFIPKPDYM